MDDSCNRSHPLIAILLAFLPVSDHSPTPTYDNNIKTSNMTTSEVAMSAELNWKLHRLES